MQAGHERRRVCHSDPRHKGPPHSIRWRRGKPVIRPHKESQRSFNIRDGTILCGPGCHCGPPCNDAIAFGRWLWDRNVDMEQWLWGGGRADRYRRGRPCLSATLLSRPKDTRFLAPGSECSRSCMGLLRETAAKIANSGPSPFLRRESPKINAFCRGACARHLLPRNHLIRLSFLPYEDWFLAS